MKQNVTLKTGAKKIAIIGAGNIGAAIARGLAASGNFKPQDIILTRRRAEFLEELRAENFTVLADNRAAVKGADIVILAVGPQEVEAAVKALAPALNGRQIVISIVTGVTTAQISGWLKKKVSLVRAMTNTAIAIREAMTCLCAAPESRAALSEAKEIFDALALPVSARLSLDSGP